jgi:hypothetical protein
VPGGEGAPREGADRRVSILVRAAEEKGVGLCVYLQVKVEVCRRFSALGSRTHRPLPRCQSSLLNYTLVVCANTVRREKERHAPSMKHGPVQISMEDSQKHQHTGYARPGPHMDAKRVRRGIRAHSHSQQLGHKRLRPTSAPVLPAEKHPSILVCCSSRHASPWLCEPCAFNFVLHHLTTRYTHECRCFLRLDVLDPGSVTLRLPDVCRAGLI